MTDVTTNYEQDGHPVEERWRHEPPRHAPRTKKGTPMRKLIAAAVTTLILAAGTVIVAPLPEASAATPSNTPVWIGAGYAGNYMSGTRPGRHGGHHVSFDYYGAGGKTVRLYAAPKNNAYNNKITAHIIRSGAGSSDAANCGYYAIVEIRHSGHPIGTVSFSHLARRASTKTISRWGGVIGQIAKLPLNGRNRCYQVRYASGRHVHIEMRNHGRRPACAHDWGAISIPETRYQGYLGDYGKAPRYGNVCPHGI